MSRLPHKAPLIYAQKAQNADENSADVELDFGEAPTLAMHIEAAAQAFSFINRQDSGTWGVVAMIKNSNLKSKCKDGKYTCKVSITQSIHPYYKVFFQALAKDGGVVADGELSIKIF
jgi:hypothetical protein